VKQSPRLMSHLQRAEDHVQNAQESWDATDLSRCAECVEYLRHAADELLLAQQFTGESDVPSAEMAAKAKDRLQRLHSSVNRLSRLVDAAMGFHRRLALDTGMEEAVTSESNG